MPAGQAPPPPPRQPAGQQPANGLGIASLVLGIASIPLCLCWGIGTFAGIAAIILGFLGRQRADQGQATNRGTAVAGIITGIVGAALGVLAWILLAIGASIDWGDINT